VLLSRRRLVELHLGSSSSSTDAAQNRCKEHAGEHHPEEESTGLLFGGGVSREPSLVGKEPVGVFDGEQYAGDGRIENANKRSSEKSTE